MGKNNEIKVGQAYTDLMDSDHAYLQLKHKVIHINSRAGLMNVLDADFIIDSPAGKVFDEMSYESFTDKFDLVVSQLELATILGDVDENEEEETLLAALSQATAVKTATYDNLTKFWTLTFFDETQESNYIHSDNLIDFLYNA